MNELHVTFDGRSYTFLPGQTVLIGRLSDNTVVVSDPTVSRRHAQLSWGPGGWQFENVGQARAFQQGQEVSHVTVDHPVELALASPQGPVLRLAPAETGGHPATERAAGPEAVPAGPAAPGAAPGPIPAGVGPGGWAEPGRAPVPGGPGQYGPADGRVSTGPGQYGPGQPGPGQYGPPGGPGGPYPPGGYGPPGGPNPPGAYTPPPGRPIPPGAAAHGPGSHHPGVADELVLAFEILVPVKTWLHNPGWRQGIRLLVIAYALLPLIFLALFSSSSSLAVPGFAYSLYVAPLWLIAFWLLVRPGHIAALEIWTGVGIVAWVTVWLYAVTVNINDQLVDSVRNGNFFAALVVGYNEEITKALPIVLAALILLKFRATKLSVRMWMFLGTVSGLTFGILEERLYTEVAIAQVAQANNVSAADAGVLDFAFRVFVDGFEHAVWAGVAAFFVGIAINYPRRRWPLILLGVSIVAVLHGLNDWSVSTFNSYWPGILIQAVSLLLFIGYTMSASSIESEVRRTPLFRGDSMVMEAFTDPRRKAASDQ